MSSHLVLWALAGVAGLALAKKSTAATVPAAAASGVGVAAAPAPAPATVPDVNHDANVAEVAAATVPYHDAAYRDGVISTTDPTASPSPITYRDELNSDPQWATIWNPGTKDSYVPPPGGNGPVPPWNPAGDPNLP